MFHTLPHCFMEAEVLGKKVNRGGGYGLEIPVRYHFLGPAKTKVQNFLCKGIRLVKKKIRNRKKKTPECKVSKYLKQRSLSKLKVH